MSFSLERVFHLSSNLHTSCLNAFNMLLMVEKDIRGVISHAIHRYVKANRKYFKNYDKNKQSSYLKNWDVNNLNGWAML